MSIPLPAAPRLTIAPAVLAVWIACFGTASASAQAVTFPARNGANLALCGVPGTGPNVNHTFPTPTATNDTISVQDPGGPPPVPASSATSTLVSSASPTGVSIAVSGAAAVGAPAGMGPVGIADSRDGWDFLVAAPVRFTLTVTLSAASTESTVPMQAFNLFAFGGAQIVPDAGTVWPPAVSVIMAPGTATTHASGTLLPGRYNVDLFGRAQGNSAPFSSSFASSLTLTFAPAATIETRQAFGNANSFTGSVPLLGRPWHANVDLTLTGHAFALVDASLSTAQVALGQGLTMLLGSPVVDFLPITPGPQAAFVFNLPASPTLAGLPLSTQALLFGGPPLQLTNALDLTLGF